MYQPDEWQQKALLTWYSVDNPLHLDPRHPCIKLAGEAGEILDLYGKHEYKPGFDWWNCKQCKRSKEYHMEQYSGKFFYKHNDGHNYYCTANEFTPPHPGRIRRLFLLPTDFGLSERSNI